MPFLSIATKTGLLAVRPIYGVFTLCFRGEVYDCLTEDGYLVSTKEQLSAVGINVKGTLLVLCMLGNFSYFCGRLLGSKGC